jgi:hypothetical protein
MQGKVTHGAERDTNSPLDVVIASRHDPVIFQVGAAPFLMGCPVKAAHNAALSVSSANADLDLQYL